MEDEAVGMGYHQHFPELLQGPGRRRVAGDEEQVVGGQGYPRPWARPQEPPEVDSKLGHHPAKR